MCLCRLRRCSSEVPTFYEKNQGTGATFGITAEELWACNGPFLKRTSLRFEVATQQKALSSTAASLVFPIIYDRHRPADVGGMTSNPPESIRLCC